MADASVSWRARRWTLHGRINPRGLLPRAAGGRRQSPIKGARDDHAAEFVVGREPMTLFDLRLEFGLMGINELRDALAERREHLAVGKIGQWLVAAIDGDGPGAGEPIQEAGRRQQQLEVRAGKDEFLFVIEGGAEGDDVVVLIERMFMLVRPAEIEEFDAIHADGDGGNVRRIVGFIGAGGWCCEQMRQRPGIEGKGLPDRRILTRCHSRRMGWRCWRGRSAESGRREYPR